MFLDYFDPPSVENGVGVSFAHEEGSFLVGAAAALESKTGRIGYIGANGTELIESFRAGFVQGARAARPDIEIVESLILPGAVFDGYQHPTEARDLAEWMYVDQGVDVIYTAAGGSGQGVIEAATDLSDDVGRHLWAIGVDTDFVFELPARQREHLLTSMLKRLDVGVEHVVAAQLDGTLEIPSALRLGLSDGAVGYSKAGGNLQPSTIEELDRFAAAISAGGLAVDDVPTDELRELPSAPLAPDTPESRAALQVAN